MVLHTRFSTFLQILCHGDIKEVKDDEFLKERMLVKKRTKKDKSKNDKKEVTIYQANPLIHARKNYGIMEHRLFRLAIADLRPKLKNSLYYDEEFRPFHMETAEVIELFQSEGMERDGLYTRLKESCRRMSQSCIEIEDENSLDIINVFDRIKIDKKKGLNILFTASMKKFLLDLEQGNYTKSLLKLSFSLSSTYALVLLELILQYQGKKNKGIIERDLSIEEIRFSMNVQEDAYDGRIDNFKRFVVDSAIREINEKTEYYLEPRYGLLRGQYNRVTGFHFVLHLPETETKEQKQPALSDGLKERLVKYRLKTSGKS